MLQHLSFTLKNDRGGARRRTREENPARPPIESGAAGRGGSAFNVVCALAAVVFLLVSTLDLDVFRERLGARFVVLFFGMVPAAVFLIRVFPAGSISAGNRRAFLVTIFVVHAISTFYFFPAGDLLNNRPVLTLDHSFHYYQAYRTREVFRETFRVDRYDPYFMAGYPGGTIFDLDMKGAELFCAVSPFFGVARCLKLFVLGVYLIMVVTVYWGSRLQGFKPEESLFGLLVFLAFWHWGRPYAGDFRYAGMFSFVCATHLCFLLVGLLRHLPHKTWLKTFLLVGPLAFLIHPTALVMLPVPFIASIAVYHRCWNLTTFLWLGLWGLGIVFINFVWLEPFFEYIWIKTTTEAYYQIEGCRALVAVVAKPGCSIALGMILLSLAGLWRLIRERRLFVGLPVFLGSVFFFVVAACGVYLWGMNQLEPGRFLFSGFLFLTPVSGVGAARLIQLAVAKFGPERRRARARSVLVAALVLIMLPLSMFESKAFYRHTISTTYPPRIASLIEAVKSRVDKTGRLMIEDVPASFYGEVHLPALLPLITGVEQIGGPYPHTFLLYHFATFEWDRTFGRPLNQWDSQALRPYLDMYNVRWILTAKRESGDCLKKLLGIEPAWEQGTYMLWELEPLPRAENGHQPTVTAEINRITVENAGDVESYLLSYHWVPGLSVTPPARIYAKSQLKDPVPFVVVEPNGLSRVEITY